MPAFWARIFGSRQVRDCETALGHLRPFFDDVLHYTQIEAEVRDIIVKNPKLVEQKVLIESHSPQQVALQLIGGVAYGKCVSGNHHTYRGILSMSGKDFRRIVSIVHERLIAIGTLDGAEAIEIRNELDQEIKEVG